MPTAAAKFQDLLRELFQFDCADLDFGIYRVMNHKRDAIERFIAERLPETVSAELARGAMGDQDAAHNALESARGEVRKTLGADAIDADGALDAAFRNTPTGRRYLQARANAAGARPRDAVETDVYNRLYNFFRRYWQDGDFISKRRYSRSSRYAIPYNGEEVYLHWANNDQYYVKTDEHFRNYDWNAPNGVAVRFRVRAANVENGNVKGDRRFFLPRAERAEWDANARAATIPFEYRPLSAAEQRAFGTRNQQDKITAAAVRDIPKRLAALDAPADALAALQETHRANGNGEPVSRLEHHLKRYARKNESDFFIHKDLSGFLNRELDFYIKNEVLNLDDLAAAGEWRSDGWFQTMRLIKAIGGDIIDFLAQIEGFQKTLWEKRKFVTDVQYCVTMGAIDARFHADILANDAQWAEWRDLFGASDADRKPAFLKANPTLTVDTAHFGSGFADRLLASFDDIDGMTDGVLVHGENWQALRLMEETYRGRVNCVYIDPPYNTDASAIIYKNGYKDSSWLSLMENRLVISRNIMTQDGILCVAIDDVEYTNLQKLMGAVFGQELELGTAVVRSNPAGRSTPTGFSSSHEYAMFYGNQSGSQIGRLPRTEKQISRYKFDDEKGRFEWVNFRKHGGLNAYRTARPRLFYPLYVDARANIRVPNVTWIDSRGEYQIDDAPRQDEITVWPISDNGEEKTWKWGRETLINNLSEFSAKPNRVGEMNIYMRSRMKTEGTLPTTWWDKKEYSAAEHGTRALINLFGDARGFSFPKSTRLVEDCIRASGGDDDDSVVLDYFAGSGTTAHAVINLNREDGGSRKFVLVEMGEYFDTVLLPRVKKVIFSPEWRGGKPNRAANGEESERSPRIVKYIRIESYEDALDGIEFDAAAGAMNLEDRIEGYLLKYMLKWETKGSRTLLNLSQLTRPFDYRLRSRANGERRESPADLAETFNWLIGLSVKTRRTHRFGNRRYLVYRGETRDDPGRETVVIWRDTAGWSERDFRADSIVVMDSGMADGADTLYINGGSAIPGSKAVETLFLERMFAGVVGERRLDGSVR